MWAVIVRSTRTTRICRSCRKVLEDCGCDGFRGAEDSTVEGAAFDGSVGEHTCLNALRDLVRNDPTIVGVRLMPPASPVEKVVLAWYWNHPDWK